MSPETVSRHRHKINQGKHELLTLPFDILFEGVYFSHLPRRYLNLSETVCEQILLGQCIRVYECVVVILGMCLGKVVSCSFLRVFYCDNKETSNVIGLRCCTEYNSMLSKQNGYYYYFSCRPIIMTFQ